MTSTALPTLDQALQTARAGAKATALSRLTAARLPVPDGLVIPVDHPDHLMAGAVTEILARCPAPYGLIARSSAVAEDGDTASFAGLYTSRFAPAEPAALLDAVRAVRASTHNPAIAAYSHALGTTALPQMAVLVQAALRPACSGVLAAHVAGGRCIRWRIEAVRGLAAPLVDGSQAGEIHTRTPAGPASVYTNGQPVFQLPGTPAELTMPPGEWVPLGLGCVTRAKIQTSDAGVLHLHTPAALADAPVLNREQCEELLATAAWAADALGLENIDVEWAITFDGRLHLVQARPLTAPLADDPAPRGPVLANGQLLSGIAASPGTGSGAVVPDADTDIAGRVLVCDALGPEAVSALLSGPAAVVATTGGQLSHTAIITRELGIPCVTNVADARTAIAPGDMVEVDGGAGTVRLAPSVPAQRTAPARSLAATAVLTRALDRGGPANGRAATILWHDPHSQAGPTDFGTGGVHPVGVLIPASLQDPVTVPPGHRAIPLPGLGTLLWPYDAPPPPGSIAVLGPDGQVLHQRAVPR
ncbi:PEP/pyruvate-binding domain-containing protein [Kitasatospora sp. NPDC088346]|uniref:PEP/pyruvate-binding domain-containing protein n=1 Tax=Kitasatospora sp. NPDC088346 TaxID=3364073 RepID=UPI003820EE73